MDADRARHDASRASDRAFELCYEQQRADGAACSCWSVFESKHSRHASPAQRLYVKSEQEMCNPKADPLQDVHYPAVTSAWKTCFHEFAAALKKADAATLHYTERLALLGQHCGANLGMLPTTNVMTGTQYQQDGVNVFQLHLEDGACYSILGAADDSVGNLDLALRLDGMNVATDTARDNYPSVGYCARQSGTYQIIIAVESGRGHYAVQVWKRPNDPAQATEKPTLTVSL